MLVSACLKYPPVRDAFDAAAKRELRGGQVQGGHGVRGGPSRSDDLGVSALFRILTATCERLQHVRMVVWTANCGRTRMSGFLPWMTRWHVLKKAAEGERLLRAAKCLRLGQGAQTYRVMFLSDGAVGALTPVLATHSVAKALQLRPSGAQSMCPQGSMAYPAKHRPRGVPGVFHGARAF